MAYKMLTPVRCLLVALLAGGCTEQPEVMPHWSSELYREGFRTVTASDPCRNCIELDRVVTLGEADGPSFLEWGDQVVRDSLGRYWVSQPGAPKVFEANGRYVREVGRVGQGPMEFSKAWPAFVDSRGFIHVFDVANTRVSVINPSFALESEERLVNPMWDVERLNDDNGYVANMWVPTAEQIGQPLHTVRDGEIVASYGATTSSGLIDERLIRRLFSVDDTDRVFSAKVYEYEIEVWSADGRRVAGFRGPPLNDGPIVPGAISRENPYPNTIRDINIDADERLWLMIWMLRPDWLDHMEEFQRSTGELFLRMKSTSTVEDIWTSRIDVIDLDTSALIARTEGEALMARFLDDRSGWAPQYLADGSPQVAVWRMSWAGDGH